MEREGRQKEVECEKATKLEKVVDEERFVLKKIFTLVKNKLTIVNESLVEKMMRPYGRRLGRKRC